VDFLAVSQCAQLQIRQAIPVQMPTASLHPFLNCSFVPPLFITSSSNNINHNHCVAPSDENRPSITPAESMYQCDITYSVKRLTQQISWTLEVYRGLATDPTTNHDPCHLSKLEYTKSDSLTRIVGLRLRLRWQVRLRLRVSFWLRMRVLTPVGVVAWELMLV